LGSIKLFLVRPPVKPISRSRTLNGLQMRKEKAGALLWSTLHLAPSIGVRMYRLVAREWEKREPGPCPDPMFIRVDL
jgi:hypothetical protein